MSGDLDTRLTRLWTDEAPPVRDAAFRLAVLERAARRRLRWRIAGLTAIAIAGAAALIVAGPANNEALAIGFSILSLAAPAWLAVRRRFSA